MTARDKLLRETQLAARRLLAARESRADLIRFTQFVRPDPEDFENPDASSYRPAEFHRFIARKLMALEKGKIKRLALTTPPQHGKSTLAAISFLAWVIGRDPRLNLIFGTYNEVQADRIGGEVREIMQSPAYAQVFPKVVLRVGSAAKNHLATEAGGQINFIGRGGSGTGLPADLIVIDDPIKGKDEARSPTIIEGLHEWYSSVMKTRVRKRTRIMIIHTRWIENDLIGRQCDPDHPWRLTYAGQKEAARWEYINMPAILRDDEVAVALGKNSGDLLWPEEISQDDLDSQLGDNPGNFSALYLGRPTPDDGDYFKLEGIVEYDPNELPSNLRRYGASDHATSEKRKNDATVLGCVGIDERNIIWVLPDLVIRRMETPATVQELIRQFKVHKPQLWWMEDELISKSFGPFLRQEMLKERTFVTIQKVRPSTDKLTRARSAQGMMDLKQFRFPRYARWWAEARAQLLKFPIATHDDFVDWLAHVAQGCEQIIRAPISRADNDDRKVGSIEWMMKQTRKRAMREKMKTANAGW